MSINLSGRFWDWRTDLARDGPGTSSSSPASPAPSTPTPTSRRGRGGGSSPPRRRTLSALFSLARGESNDDNEVNRPTISRPILNHGPIPMPGNGDFVYVHPSRPRLDVEIPRSSFSAFELWEGSGVERASEGRRSVEEMGGVGSVTDLDDDDEETMLGAAALPGARSTDEVADLDATYLLPFVSSTPAPSFSSSSATLVPSSAPSVHVHFADEVQHQDGGLQREQSARWLHHPLRQHPPPPNSAPAVVAARARAPSPHPNIIGQRDGTPPPGPDRPRGKKKKQSRGLCCGLFGQEEEDESEELEMEVLGQGEGGEEVNGPGRQQQQQQQRRSVRDSWVTVSRWTE